MKRLRGIHLFFILLIAAVILCFWFGFQFGKETQRQVDLLASSEEKLKSQSEDETEVASNISENNENTVVSESTEAATVTTPESNSDLSENTVEASSKYEQPKFYLKQSGEYVSVYVSATDEVYFETDILVEDLPIELQEEMQYGIDFYDLNGVYTFLENYSS